MSILLFGVRWASLSHSWIALILAAVFGCYLYRNYKVASALAQLAGKWRHLLIENYSTKRATIKTALFGVAMLFIALAALRPQWNQHDTIMVQEGRDLLIALDISRSMLATDCKPNRLAVAKKKIKQLLSMLSCERVGLMLFSGSAFVQCPLTTDYSSFHMFLDNVDVETISSGSTALDAALRTSLELFNNGSERKNKLLVIFTDGEDFSSNLSELKKEAQRANLRIFTIGVGTQDGAPIPLYDIRGNPAGHQKDGRGAVVISRLNDGILQSLAADMGGVYLPVSQDKSDLSTLVQHLSRYEKEQFEDKQVRQYEDKYHYFALVSFFCLLMEWIV
jgi:Ca-activated chloride channel family protein